MTPARDGYQCCSLAARLDTYFIESHADIAAEVECILALNTSATHVVHLHPLRQRHRRIRIKGQLTSDRALAAIRFGGPSASANGDEWEEPRTVSGYPEKFNSASIQARSAGTENIRLHLFEETIFGGTWVRMDDGILALPIQVS